MAANFLTITDQDKPLTATGVRNRRIAELLKEGASTEPIGSHWQGLNRVAQSLLGGLQLREADKEEKANQALQTQTLAALLTGSNPPQQSPASMPPMRGTPPTGFAPPAPPMGAPPAPGNVTAPVPPDDPTMTISPRQVAQANPGMMPPPAAMPTPTPSPPTPPGPMQGAPQQPPMTSHALPPDMQARIAAMLDPRQPPAVQAMGRQLAAKIVAERMKPVEGKSVVIGERGYSYDPITRQYTPGPDATKTPDAVQIVQEMFREPTKYGFKGPDDPALHEAARKRLSGQSSSVSVSTVADPIHSGVGKQIVDAREVARGVPDRIQAIHTARAALDAGATTGALADWRLSAQKLFGLSPEDVANTEVFRAAVGKEVLGQIKALGANPSNTDREYIEKVSGGQITLDEKSLRRILDIQEKYARQALRLFNREAKTLMDANPEQYRSIRGVMQFEEPPEYTPPQRPPSAPAGSGGGWQTLPNGVRIRPKQ